MEVALIVQDLQVNGAQSLSERSGVPPDPRSMTWTLRPLTLHPLPLVEVKEDELR